MKFTRILLLLVLPAYLFSCHPLQKLPNYIENVVDTSGKTSITIPELRIQKNDLLSIQVYSKATPTKEMPDIDQLYNLPITLSTIGGTQSATSAAFLVDINGNIEHPKLGVFHAEGLTKEELAAEIKKSLTQPVELLKDPIVIIRFLNFHVTVSGEVTRAGTIPVPGERITILEAIALAGDVTQYGRKNTVKVVRETNGERKIGIIDLSSKDLFESPYYNLQQNDMVLVEATKQKRQQTDQAIVSQRISIAIGLITAAAFIYNIFK